MKTLLSAPGFIRISKKLLSTFSLLFSIIVTSLTSCSDDESPAQEPHLVLSSLTYNVESLLPHNSDKDSIIYSSTGAIESFIQVNATGDDPVTTFHYDLETNGNILVRKNDSETIVFTDVPEADSVRIRHYTQYSNMNNLPTYMKFFNGRYRAVFERWEYSGQEESFDMETDGQCVKRIEITKDRDGNVTKIDNYAYTNGALMLTERYQAFTYTELDNPLKGFYLEPIYMQNTYNKLPVAYELSSKLFNYYERYVYNSSGNSIISQYYNVEYSVDEKGRATGSNVSMNSSDFVPDIASIRYIGK